MESKMPYVPQSHVKRIDTPAITPKKVVEDNSYRKLSPPPSTSELSLAHAKKLDKNLRIGNRYPYLPNATLRSNLLNPGFLEDNLARDLA